MANRYPVRCGLAVLLLITPVSGPSAQPTDKRPPGMNQPVGVPNRPGPGGGPGPDRPPAPARPPSPARPPFRPRPGPPAGRPFPGHIPRHRYRLGAYARPNGYFFRQWDTGAILPPLFRAPNYWLNSPAAYGLRRPPPGAQWVRVDYDALLVLTATGQVVDVVYNIFY